MENQSKKVLLASNGDEVSVNIALHLAKRGCRLVLMGNESCLRSARKKITNPTKNMVPVEVVGLDMEEEREEAFDEAVDKAWKAFGFVDIFVNYYAYEECGSVNQAVPSSSCLRSSVPKEDSIKDCISFGDWETQDQVDEFPPWVGKETAEKLVERAAPLQRWLDVEKDLASTVIYLISDGSLYMSGTTIFVDGAQSMARPRMRSYM
ncbi:CONSTANS interacting protein 6 [Hibiscus syriacus]|uniref:CONSTANS interacting protein 6 n=1 Tax=Hibiscus syriacus TaxID=106335 RepID=A0A6A3BI23_HIBSY|nr:CONSTANS interacting protein 6 [Hibiscus syriacus]